MLGACLRLGGLLVDHPFKGVGGFVQLRAARAGVPVVAVIGMPAGVVRSVFRELRDHDFGKICNFFGCVLISEILIAAVAVPIFNIALGQVRSGGFRNFQQICVDISRTVDTQDKVKGAFFLDIIIRQRMSVLQLFPSENQPLLIGRNPFFLLYLALYVIDRVCQLYLERDGLACERFYKNLHGKSRG